jgi:hypothetical protein
MIQEINTILSRNQLLGNILFDSFDCYKQEIYSTAVFGMLISLEQFIKEFNEDTNGKFSKSVKSLLESKKIDEATYKKITEIRVLRNKLFHENLVSWGILIEGINHSFAEPETQKKLFEIYFQDILLIIVNLYNKV